MDTTNPLLPPPRHLQRRAEAWTAVWRRLGRLPPDQLLTSLSLRYHLAASFSDDCALEAILARPIDFPWLDLAGWLLDDLGVADTPERRRFEQRVFVAAFFDFAARFLRESMADPHSAFGDAARPLSETLARWARREWLGLLPGWAHLPAACANADQVAWRARMQDPWPPVDVAEPPHLLASARCVLAAVAVFTGKSSLLAEWEAWLEPLLQAAQFNADLVAIRRDLQLGRSTSPILAAARVAGAPHRAAPDQWVWTLAFKDLVAPLAAARLASLDISRAQSAQWQWPTLTQWAQSVAHETRTLAGLLSLRAPPLGPRAPRQLTPPAPASLPMALSMAERFLTADPTLREAWDVQRWGLFGESEVEARLFIPGLILEVLARHQLATAAQIDAWLEACLGQACRYFDHAATPPDADTITLALRLLPFSATPEKFRPRFTTPLHWVQINQRADGLIPCWLARQAGSTVAEEVGAFWWEPGCSTVEAHVVLGLLADETLAQSESVQALLHKAIPGWLGRMAAAGLGRATFYAPAYGLWRSLELLEKLRGLDGVRAWRPLIRRVEKGLLTDGRRALRQESCSPQDLAFLLLAARHTSVPAMPHAEAVTRLLKTQQPDGSWPGAPFYLTPMYGRRSSWFASRTLATAYAYEALRMPGVSG